MLRHDTALNLAHVVGLGHKMTLALRSFAIGACASMAVWLIFDPSMLVILGCGTVAGFAIGALSAVMGDWLDRVLDWVDK